MRHQFLTLRFPYLIFRHVGIISEYHLKRGGKVVSTGGIHLCCMDVTEYEYILRKEQIRTVLQILQSFFYSFVRLRVSAVIVQWKSLGATRVQPLSCRPCKLTEGTSKRQLVVTKKNCILLHQNCLWMQHSHKNCMPET